MTAKYRLHRFDLRMTRGQNQLEQFLSSLELEKVAAGANSVAAET